ncbi:hypothetical protein HN695_06450 [Candidatus Woesearchaeota archaeon]|nr:hypothetical protein [Candidatus Woesearchaeota archaeon]MBT6336110.1 hypothetical protein [Candidatus Woesearchaeota archaeon]MBT7927947.1 hypothetical protein [Candidatus Woesearchaeota archaeon]
MQTYNKVLLFGDLHLGDINFNLERELINVINNDNYDCIVIGGDTFDPWRGEKVSNLIIKHKRLFNNLKNKNVIFIKGNHDSNLEELEKAGFIIKKYYQYLTKGKKKVKVLHGHEFDKYRAYLEFMGKIMAYSEEKINRLLNALRAPFRFRIAKLGFGLDRPTIWLALRRKHYIYSDANYLIFGHTHTPMRGKIKGTKFYNWGSWQRDRGYRPSYIINEGNNFKIEFLKIKRSKLLWKVISILSNLKENYLKKRKRVKTIRTKKNMKI